MQFLHDIYTPSPLELLESRFFPGIELWIKRDDLLHPQVSGNKFRKLKYPLLALQGKQPVLVTMGGAWSNHLHAIAHAAKLLGYPLIGLVRGHVTEGGVAMTPTLSDCQAMGMQICLLNREAYRRLRDVPEAWRDHMAHGVADYVWLPEGGSAPQALHGVAELVDEVSAQLATQLSMASPVTPDTLIVACGTGATMAGLLAGMRGRGRVIGVAVLKNAAYLHAELVRLLQQAAYPEWQNYELLTQFHQGGYGKAPPHLRQFCEEFSAETGVPLEPVYTGKMFYALHQLVLAGKFRQGERVVAVHTGGLQGARGFI